MRRRQALRGKGSSLCAVVPSLSFCVAAIFFYHQFTSSWNREVEDLTYPLSDFSGPTIDARHTSRKERQTTPSAEESPGDAPGSLFVETDHEVPEEIAPTHTENTKRSKNLWFRLYNRTDAEEHHDYFASAWWQTKERFRDADKSSVGNLEGGIRALTVRARFRGWQEVRLTRDYLDFSVEHLSRWWKKNPADTSYGVAIGKLQSYSQRSCARPKSDMMKSSLALIPHTLSESASGVNKRIWKESLLATTCSLIQHGIHRITMVVYFDPDIDLVEKVLKDIIAITNSDNTVHREKDYIHTVVKGIEIAAIRIYDAPMVGKGKKTDVLKDTPIINVPLGALHGMESALRNGTQKEKWIGQCEDCEFIYFTESDQILNARIDERFYEEMRKGNVIVPHRLQPIMHTQDFEGIPSMLRVLPREFDQVMMLNEESSCCDTGIRAPRPNRCVFSWDCGFPSEKVEDYRHLDQFQFMSLLGGTGIVSLSGTEHVRICKPSVERRNC